VGGFMYKRNQTRKVFVKDLQIGGNDNIIIQSMCNIKTSNVEKVIQQILMLEKYGCELIRVSILDEDDANAIKEIKNHIHIPLVADIHFDYKLALLCIENGVDKIRINPGNIGKIENIKAVVDACKTFNIPIRIGINSGSLEEDLKNQYGVIKAQAPFAIVMLIIHIILMRFLAF
jgi:(E)-4-hydroxy-3-methylbut-2-enyl-diphosphate synthase